MPTISIPVSVNFRVRRTSPFSVWVRITKLLSSNVARPWVECESLIWRLCYNMGSPSQLFLQDCSPQTLVLFWSWQCWIWLSSWSSSSSHLHSEKFLINRYEWWRQTNPKIIFEIIQYLTNSGADQSRSLSCYPGNPNGREIGINILITFLFVDTFNCDNHAELLSRRFWLYRIVSVSEFNWVYRMIDTRQWGYYLQSSVMISSCTCTLLAVIEIFFVTIFFFFFCQRR